MTARDRDLLLLAALAWFLWPRKSAQAALPASTGPVTQPSEVDQHGTIAVEVESLDEHPSGPPASAASSF